MPANATSAALLFALTGAGLWVGVPVARLGAAPSLAYDPWALATSPAARALTGAVVELRSPGTGMLRVPAGNFEMGSSLNDVIEATAACSREPLGQVCRTEAFAGELGVHRVTLSSYWLDLTEVTVDAYQRCATVHRCRPAPFAAGGRRFDRPSYPASLVSHEDAAAYCAFRRARLPTEAEFERAARGPRRRAYPWGNLYNSHVVNHGRLGVVRTDAGDGFGELAPVGSFPAGRTAEGFLDLAGNVAEWTRDAYVAGYPELPVVDPEGPDAGASGVYGRVLRGGDFESGAAWLRGAARGAADPSVRAPTVGFRCARATGARRPGRASAR